MAFFKGCLPPKDFVLALLIPPPDFLSLLAEALRPCPAMGSGFKVAALRLLRASRVKSSTAGMTSPSL